MFFSGQCFIQLVKPDIVLVVLLDTVLQDIPFYILFPEIGRQRSRSRSNEICGKVAVKKCTKDGKVCTTIYVNKCKGKSRSSYGR